MQDLSMRHSYSINGTRTNRCRRNPALQQGASQTIWTFWEGTPSELVLRCIASMKLNNPTRPVVILNKATLSHFLDPEDFPQFGRGRPGSPEDFSSIQYLADWVRLTLLEKYGGVWLDASTLCTNAVDSWISCDNTKLTMFPMHANKNIHGNWAMASARPGHMLIRAWRAELCEVFDECGPRRVPTDYIARSFQDYPQLHHLWNCPSPPPLPYLWVYLAIQVVLQKEPGLHAGIHLLPSASGPMYRRHLYNVREGIEDGTSVSKKTADHLANRPLQLLTTDRWFIKFVGSDRDPVQAHLAAKTFAPCSGLDFLRRWYPVQPISFGKRSSFDQRRNSWVGTLPLK